jgi:hypothetical protein
MTYSMIHTLEVETVLIRRSIQKFLFYFCLIIKVVTELESPDTGCGCGCCCCSISKVVVKRELF